MGNDVHRFRRRILNQHVHVPVVNIAPLRGDLRFRDQLVYLSGRLVLLIKNLKIDKIAYKPGQADQQNNQNDKKSPSHGFRRN